MKFNFLSQTILAAAAVTVSAVTAIGPSASAAELSFGCEDIDGVWTTVATTVATETQTSNSQGLFYWHSDALEPSVDAQEQCQRVSDRLQNAGGNHELELQERLGRPALYLKNPGRDRFPFSASDRLQNAGGNHELELQERRVRPPLYLKNPGRGTMLFSASDSSKMKRIFPNMDRFLLQDQRQHPNPQSLDIFGRPVSIWYLLGFSRG